MSYANMDRRVPREKKNKKQLKTISKVVEWKVIFAQSVTVLFSSVFIFFFSRWLFFLLVAESA